MILTSLTSNTAGQKILLLLLLLPAGLIMLSLVMLTLGGCNSIGVGLYITSGTRESPKTGTLIYIGTQQKQDITTTLEVKQTDDALFFTLKVSNNRTEPVVLGFRSGEMYNIIVTCQNSGEIVHDSGTDRMYTMALQEHTIEPGDTLVFNETWQDPLKGYYTATGIITVYEETTSNIPLEALQVETSFQVK